jgi:carbamoyltransferase
MNIIGYSGIDQYVSFKKRAWPNLARREYRIGQGFDSAAALFNKSGIVAAAAEERFTGDKATGAFPANAIRYCLSAGNLDLRDIDYIAHGFAYEPYKVYFDQEEYTRKEYAELYSPEAQLAILQKHFPEVNWKEKYVPVPHHLAHAASAHYLSGFDKSLIFVTDGMGEMHSMTIAVGEGRDIRVLKQVPALHSLGILYGIFTMYMGFCMNMDEYKVMGLAPYGNPRKYFDKVMQFVSLKPDGTYIVPLLAKDETLEQRERHTGALQILADTFGPPRAQEGPMTQDHKDLASSLQAVFQTCQLHVLKHFRKETGMTNLCMAGGAALNCTANGAIKRSRLFQHVFVQPAAGDDGTALGAALYAQRLHDPEFKPAKMSVPLCGPEFTQKEIEAALAKRTDVKTAKIEPFEKLCDELVVRLNKGEIAAWFQGRMEFGPRALGSRSILADPRDPMMRDKINSLVKKREGFRPFAPVVTVEGASRFFEITPGDEDAYSNMLFVMPVRPAYRDKLPAITHVDGSARVQTVSREQNPRLWMLLQAWEKVSGYPILLNTSFNVRGQPIVCAPTEGIDTFLQARLHLLVMGDCLVLPNVG